MSQAVGGASGVDEDLLTLFLCMSCLGIGWGESVVLSHSLDRVMSMRFCGESDIVRHLACNLTLQTGRVI